jgi:tetratricopeptide (TPR) repeat protein
LSRLPLLLFLILLSSVAAVGAESTSIGDFLQQGWQAERQGNSAVALKAYSSALALRPDDPQLNLKVAELVSATSKAPIATYLVKALDALQKDPKSPLDLKISICGALMGQAPREWRVGRLSQVPYTSLPEFEQKRLSKAFPDSWFFPSKSAELGFRIAIGEKERALKLATEAVTAGDTWSPLQPAFTSAFSESARRQMAKSWIDAAKTTNNMSLWLGALALYVRLNDLKAFKQTFPQALQIAKNDYGSLRSLGDLCRQAGWTEEQQKIEELYSAQSESDLRNRDITEMEKLIKVGDRAQVATKLRAILATYPDSYYYALDIDNLVDIVNKGWGDLLVEVISTDMLTDLCDKDIRTDDVLVASSLFNKPRLDYWVRRLIGRYASDDAFCGSMATTLNSLAPEDKIWLFDQFTRMFPNNGRVREALASAYIEAGYPNRALPVLPALMKKCTYSDASRLVFTYWRAAEGSGKFAEVLGTLWVERQGLPPCVRIEIAGQYSNKNNAEEAQKWLADMYGSLTAPTGPNLKDNSNLWTQSTYEVRLQVLAKLGKKDELNALLAEAQRLFPDYSFADRLARLGGVVQVDWNDEVRRQSQSLKTLDAATNGRIPCREFMALAKSLVNAGRAAEAASLAAGAFPIHTQWQQGLPLAVAMLSNGAGSVVPFVDWLVSVSPKQEFAGTSSQSYADEVFRDLQAKDKTLAHAFAVAAALLGPENGYANYISQDAFYRGGMKEDDLEVLVPALSKRKLNRGAMSMMAQRYGYGGQAPAMWAMELVASQTWSAAGLILNLCARSGMGPAEEIKKTLDMLEAQQDWAEADVSMLSRASSGLMKRGMNAEAERALAIGLQHADERQHRDLVYASAAVSGQPPSGESAADPDAWAGYAIFCRDKKRMDDARSAATQAVQLAKTNLQSFHAMSALAAVDPNAMDQIVPQFSKFTEGNREHLRDLGELIFRLVKADHKLAVQAAPLLDKAVQCDDNYRIGSWADAAACDIWSWHTEAAISLMLPRLQDDWGLGKAVSFLCKTEMSIDARKSVEQAMDKTLASDKAELSYIAEECGRDSVFGSATPEGLASLGRILTRRVQAVDGVVPAKLLDYCINGLSLLQNRLEPSPQMTQAWYQVTETIIKKAAQKPEDAKSVAELVNKAVDRLKSWGMKDTDTLQRLSALANSLK